MAAIYWYIVRLDRPAVARLIRHNGKKNLGNRDNTRIKTHDPHSMRFHKAATGE